MEMAATIIAKSDVAPPDKAPATEEAAEEGVDE